MGDSEHEFDAVLRRMKDQEDASIAESTERTAYFLREVQATVRSAAEFGIRMPEELVAFTEADDDTSALFEARTVLERQLELDEELFDVSYAVHSLARTIVTAKVIDGEFLSTVSDERNDTIAYVLRSQNISEDQKDKYVVFANEQLKEVVAPLAFVKTTNPQQKAIQQSRFLEEVEKTNEKKQHNDDMEHKLVEFCRDSVVSKIGEHDDVDKFARSVMSAALYTELARRDAVNMSEDEVAEMLKVYVDHFKVFGQAIKLGYPIEDAMMLLFDNYQAIRNHYQD